MKLFIATVASIIIFCSCINKTSNDIASVKIGTQVWTAQNLDVSIFRNGDTIPEIESRKEFYKAGLNGKPAWCYYDGDPANRKKYGKLYNWYAVSDSRGIAPKGWHIPTNEEWTILIGYLGGNTIAGEKMKSSKEWDGDNSSGFNALPAGFSSRGTSNSLGTFAFFWSTSEFGTKDALAFFKGATHIGSGDAWGRYLFSGKAQSFQGSFDEAFGYSVRCLRD